MIVLDCRRVQVSLRTCTRVGCFLVALMTSPALFAQQDQASPEELYAAATSTANSLHHRSSATERSSFSEHRDDSETFDLAAIAPEPVESQATDTPQIESETRMLPPPTIRSVKDSLQQATGRDMSWLVRRGGIGLAIFVALVAVQRVFVPESKPKLQNGAVQVCGKVRLDAKQFLHLVRIGERMLVLLESPSGMQRLAEITDPNEIERIVSPNGKRTQRTDASPRVDRVAASATELLEQIRRVDN